MADNIAVIAGATGAAASRLVELLAETPGWQVVGLCRRLPDAPHANVRYLAADLADAASCRRAVDAAGTVTHVVYAARAAFAEGGVEDVPANVTMLRNLLDACDRPGLRHVHLLEGTKWYGLHLGPFATPAREDDPRHMPPNFYYDQQDLLMEHRTGKGWSWSASRPNLIVDFAPGRARNLVSTIGAWAAICRELGLPLDFPGRVGAYTMLTELTDARLLARAIRWMLTDPRAADRAFNITNGDLFRWSRLWPCLAAYFGLQCGQVRPMRLATWMADKEAVWQRVSARHGLAPRRLSEVERWDFADFALGFEYDVISSMTRAREAGFHDVLDTEAMLLSHLDAYREAHLLP
jgi:nucleoside-diphosphate-sugar epimerase